MKRVTCNLGASIEGPATRGRRLPLSSSKPCTVTSHRMKTSWSFEKEILWMYWKNVMMAGLLERPEDLSSLAPFPETM
ncbi:uncharacterized protein [Scyliorhinus torazame]|uniref:uncharacterized protein isoform X2 n=1 Tax=Scyliorhinus torazame TaxID=75743 RepID=UPI003B5AD8C5